MKEIIDIIAAYDKAVLCNKQVAMATVVEVEGSSYRRPGARMLITEDGEITGAISGGCLEGDALRKAQFAIFNQKNKMVIYDTINEDDLKFGVQLGCNGIVYILFEPIEKKDINNPIQLLKKISSHGSNMVLLTLFNRNSYDVQKGTCGFVGEEGENFLIGAETKLLISECDRVLSTKKSLIKHYEGSSSVLFHFVALPVRLMVIGAGNDAKPLVDLASLLGWNITVADGRTTHATYQRFPKASNIIIAKSVDIASQIAVDERTAVVIMTHNYNYDIEVLATCINTNCNYIGILGPREKLYKMFDELRERGIIISAETIKKIYGPVGLDLGAETAEEIALSVLAEIKAVFSDRKGLSLRTRLEQIHNRNIISNA